MRHKTVISGKLQASGWGKLGLFPCLKALYFH